MAKISERTPDTPPRSGAAQAATARIGAAQAASRARRIGGIPSELSARRGAVTTRHADKSSERTEQAIRRARGRSWIAAIVAAALVVGLAVADVTLFQEWRNRPGTAQQRERLVASVNQSVAKILSYDYRHLDADENAAAAHLTGTFKNQYVASMDTTIKKNAPPAKAVVVGEVGTSAITSVSGDGTQAVLLVLGQQTVTNAAQKTPRYDMVNLRVTAQLVHGTWLIADLATL
jgi:Mce-associated membrane protein